ncbi:MAG: hypothetical protein HRT87_12480 [Legionellales bacterium]|nr:hypothetical protein [Legionellales bacterium]
MNDNNLESQSRRNFFTQSVVLASGAFSLQELKELDISREIQIYSNEYKYNVERKRIISSYTDMKFIELLPKARSEVYEKSQVKWDTGVTSKMREGNYDLIDFLSNSWLTLSNFYPPKNFGGIDSEEYIKNYTKERFDYHWSKHTSSGKFDGGNMVIVIIGGDVSSDLERLVDDLVYALLMYEDKFNYMKWSKKWKV